VDTTKQLLPYPQCRTYAWERIGSQAHDQKFWRSIASNAKSASKNGRAVLTWKRVIEELYRLADEESKGTFTPDEFKAILIEQACNVGWFQAESGRKGFTSEVEGRPDLKRCAKCQSEKPKADFNAEASDKRKLNYNWGKDGTPAQTKRFYSHHLCANCRADKKRKPVAKRGTDRCAPLRKQMDLVYKLSHNFVTTFEQDNDIFDPDWVCLDQRYFFHKIRLDAVRKARDELLRMDLADEELPEKWQMLIPATQRHALFTRFQEDVMPMWSGKGKQPKCF